MEIKATFCLLGVYKSIALAMLLLFVCAGLHAQVVVEGTVTDSLNNPLVNASLVAKPQDSTAQVRFAVTGENGTYSLNLDAEPYTVTTRFLGYKPFMFKVKPPEKRQRRDIVLEYAPESLDEVVLELPITVKKDTIIYNVDDFTTGEERKLKDVLEKLPGVEVDKNGNIYVQGKKSTKFLVENKDFFGGDSKLGVENIPADAIDKVEALDNYNEIPFLKGLDGKDELAINIKLKEGKKNFVFGSLEAGAGNESFYNARSNLYYYSKKTSLNSIANINNIRERAFTYRQYSNFKGGLNSVFSQGTTTIASSEDDLRQFTEDKDVIQSRRQFGAVNIFHEANTKLNLSGYGIVSRTDEGSLTRSRNIYDTFTENRDITTVIDNQVVIGNLQASYVPNLKDRWYFKTNFKRSDNDLLDTTLSTIEDAEDRILRSTSNVSQAFDQVVEWHRKASKKHTLSFGAIYSFKDGRPNTNRQTTDDILEGLIPIAEEDTIRLLQDVYRKSNNLKAIFKHYWILDRNNHIYSTAGGNYINADFNNRDFQLLQDGSVNDFEASGFNNQLNFNLLDSYLGLYYKRKMGKITLGQGLFLHNYNWNVNQQPEFSKNKWVLLPEFLAEYEINNRREIKFNYSLESNFTAAENYANRFLVESYNRLFRGNGRLENQLSHSLQLSLNQFSKYRGLGYYFIASYKQQIEGIQRAINTEENSLVLSPRFIDNGSRNWRLFGRLYQKVSKFNLSLGLTYDNRKNNQLVNEVLQENRSISWSYNFNVKTRFKKLPSVNLNFRQSFTNFSLGDRNSEFVTTIPSIAIDYDFWNGFIATFDYASNFYKNRQTNQTNTFALSSTSLFYGFKNSPWSLELQAHNLFDVGFKNENTVNSFLISDRQSFILPRILLFTVGYRI